MQKNNEKLLKQSGFSLMELLIVIAVIVIVSTLALMNIGTAKTQLSRQNVALELKSAFERARFDSVKRRASGTDRANVVVKQNSFVLNTDVDQDGTIETGEERENSSWMNSVAIYSKTGAALTADVTITFDKRGEITVTPSGSEAIFLVCNGSCSTPTSSNSSLILVTRTGTVNILSGGSSAPTFATPGITSVNSSSNVNPDVKL